MSDYLEYEGNPEQIGAIVALSTDGVVVPDDQVEALLTWMLSPEGLAWREEIRATIQDDDDE